VACDAEHRGINPILIKSSKELEKFYEQYKGYNGPKQSKSDVQN
jgi:hypothetical protein